MRTKISTVLTPGVVTPLNGFTGVVVSISVWATDVLKFIESLSVLHEYDQESTPSHLPTFTRVTPSTTPTSRGRTLPLHLCQGPVWTCPSSWTYPSSKGTGWEEMTLSWAVVDPWHDFTCSWTLCDRCWDTPCRRCKLFTFGLRVSVLEWTPVSLTTCRLVKWFCSWDGNVYVPETLTTTWSLTEYEVVDVPFYHCRV